MRCELLKRVLIQSLLVGVLATGALAGSADSSPDSATAPPRATTREKAMVPGKSGKESSLARILPFRKAKKPYQVGTASWYGRQFDGRATASGEPYDMYQFTAAHLTLPLGSWVKVTNLKNHKWVLVRVNDRGPYEPNRIIDLSYSAARMLDMKDRGVAKVRLDIIDTAPGEENSMAMVGGTP